MTLYKPFTSFDDDHIIIDFPSVPVWIVIMEATLIVIVFIIIPLLFFAL